jgi:hypothetical protein
LPGGEIGCGHFILYLILCTHTDSVTLDVDEKIWIKQRQKVRKRA